MRAYPTGEGTGDQGLVAQWELRYQAKASVVPYVFFDAGRSSLERKATAPGKNSRSLSGAGVGLRYGHGPFSVDTLLARRLVGGDPQSGTRDGSVMAWLILNYAF